MSKATELAAIIGSDYDPDWMHETGLDQIAAELRRLEAVEARYQWLKQKIRPIYRPGHPKIEHYIDGQTIAWSQGEQSYSDAVDAAIDAHIAKHGG